MFFSQFIIIVHHRFDSIFVFCFFLANQEIHLDRKLDLFLFVVDCFVFSVESKEEEKNNQLVA